MPVQRLGGEVVELAVQDQGQGDPVLLLHGFPDTSRLWRHQVAALTAAGFRTIAPDLRGRGASERPEAVEAYAAPLLTADVVAVLDALEVERADVVGHDFGALIGWRLAEHHPDRVRRLVAMSVGHPGAAGKRTIEDRERAWYQLLFQFRGVAEELLQRDAWSLFRAWLREDGDVDDYVADLSRPGALTAGLNWYRANLAPELELRSPPPAAPARIDVPVLGLWSDRDHYLGEARMLASEQVCHAGWRYERIDGASHWMQLDQPQRINQLLLDFLA